MTINNRLIPKCALALANDLTSCGYEVYLVGGCVRDLIIGKEPHDYDICTNAKPEQIINALKENNYDYHTVGIKYGTITAICNTEEYEITTYRSECEYSDSRHPEKVRFENNIHVDLSRRDFTINAIAYNPITNELVDDFCGIEDINNGIIRCVGDADERFNEDAIRILRALRFAIKYSFDIGDNELKSMKANVKLLNNISKERITQELKKTLTCGSNITYWFGECKYIIEQIMPEIRKCIGFNQNNKYHKHDVYTHMTSVADLCDTDDFCIKIAALLHDIGKPDSYVEDENGHGHFYGHPEVSYLIAQSIVKSDLSLTNEQSDTVLRLIRYHDLEVASTKAAVKRAINKVGADIFSKWEILKKADIDDHNLQDIIELKVNVQSIREFRREIEIENDCMNLKQLAINGNDIMKLLNIKPCKQIGKMLSTLLEMVINEEINNERESLLNKALELSKEQLDIT